MHEADDALDIVTLIAVMAVFVPIMMICAIPFFKGDVGGFGVQIEKTALETESEIVPMKPEFTTNDVLLMLVIADRYAPEPRAIRLNTYNAPMLIPFDDSFFTSRTTHLLEARRVMPNSLPVKLELYVGSQGMRFWEVQPD